MSQLIWQIVKNNSSFLRKQKDNGTSFATEPGNVTQENRFVVLPFMCPALPCVPSYKLAKRCG